MGLQAFVELLKVDGAAIASLAGFMSLGIFAFVQALKVLRVLKTSEATGVAALAIGGVEGALVIAGYFLPAFVPVGIVIYAVAIAVSTAALGYEYLAKPIMGSARPEAPVSTEDFNA